MLVWPQQDELGAAAVVAALRRGSAAMIPDASGRDVLLGTADQRRAQMLDAALDIISERGYAETRISDVAERAGVSPALVIYYYKTKDQLLTEAVSYYEDAWFALGQTRIATLPTAAARLEEFVAMTCM